MWQNISEMAQRLWADDCGAVICTEYLMLGTILVMGVGAGLVAVRNSINNEFQILGNSIGNMRKAYTPYQLRNRINGQKDYDFTGQQQDKILYDSNGKPVRVKCKVEYDSLEFASP